MSSAIGMILSSVRLSIRLSVCCLWCCALWLNDASCSKCVWSSEQVNRKCPTGTRFYNCQPSTVYTDPIHSNPHLLNHGRWCHLANKLKPYCKHAHCTSGVMASSSACCTAIPDNAVRSAFSQQQLGYLSVFFSCGRLSWLAVILRCTKYSLP